MEDPELEKRRRARALNIIKHWRLLDDEFMKRCFKDNIPAVECILRIIMRMPTLRVIKLTVEDTVSTLSGHAVRLDVHARDADNTEYDIEVQRNKEGAGQKRARYNSSLLDLNSLKKGESYDKLPESYVIFITENDLLGHRLPLYHVDRMIRELNDTFDDGSHMIYVNGAYDGDDDVGRLMNDFRSTSPETMYYAPLREVMDRYKNNPVEVSAMCDELEKWREEERREGHTEGVIETFKNLVKDGTLTIETAAKKMGVSVADFRKMAML